MSEKKQTNSIILALVAFTAVVGIAGLIGYMTIPQEEDIIQGEIEVSEYRVSCKLPGRIVKINVKEGDYVHKGDTLAIIEVPEVNAQQQAATATEGAANALSDLANAGTRREAIESAYQIYEQSLAAKELALNTYNRMQRLFDEGVMSAQKRDEAYAAFQIAEAQSKAAQLQYELAKSGAREEEKRAAKKQAEAAKGAVNVVKSLLRETVQIATEDGEVTSIYPKVGELVGMGSPIMSISMNNDMWANFNVKEDKLKDFQMGKTIKVYIQALDKDIDMKIYSLKDQGSFAVWKATKTTGQYDIKTFCLKARPCKNEPMLRAGMTAVIR